MAKGDISSIRASTSRTQRDILPLRNANNDMWSPCSDCSSGEENSPTALNSFNWDKPSLSDKTVDFCWSPKTQKRLSGKSKCNRVSTDCNAFQSDNGLTNGYVDLKTCSDGSNEDVRKIGNKDSSCRSSLKVDEHLQKCGTGGISDNILYPRLKTMVGSVDTASSNSISELDVNEITRIPPFSSTESFLMPSQSESRTESLATKHRKDQEELKKSSWFLAGIPREAALEVLSGKPEGTFIVRESTTKPGCYALSLRVPTSKNPSGIVHYLILHTTRGYKIKGFTKEFGSLQALITHHSVMPELLPCPLSLPRFNNDRERLRREDDMESVADQHDRCSLFSDIHWLMSDLNL